MVQRSKQISTNNGIVRLLGTFSFKCKEQDWEIFSRQNYVSHATYHIQNTYKYKPRNSFLIPSSTQVQIGQKENARKETWK